MHVAVAVVYDERGRVLITRRPAHAHQGGLWEFPGGKVEAAENVVDALARELREELGIDVVSARPLIGIDHAYPDKHVFLDVWRVRRWKGEAAGREGQPHLWVDAESLRDYAFPSANIPIIQAARLPPLYAITPEPGRGDLAAWLAIIERAAAAGLNLLQCRAVTLSTAEFRRAAEAVIALCRPYGCRVLLNAAPSLAAELGAAGVHLNSARLRELDRRPLPAACWVAASCHDANELEAAAEIGADFAVLGPVRDTASHPGAQSLGWPAFRTLVSAARLPVFALGGMRAGDMPVAWQAGAQGLAMISGIWADGDPAAVVAGFSA